MITTFIYMLQDPLILSKGIIGKSNNPEKRFNQRLNEKGNTKKITWIKSLKNKGLKPILLILDEVNIDEWQFWEQHYISLYKSWGFELKNMTMGGEGLNNPTKETKDKISNSQRGKRASEETKVKMSESQKIAQSGKKLTEETKKKISNFQKGRKCSEEIRLKMIGREVSKETKEKISKFQKGRRVSKETKLKISNSMKGLPFSEERKRKISETLKLRNKAKCH